MIYNKEEKFQHIFESLKDQKTAQSMFNKFLETYPEDWKLLKMFPSKQGGIGRCILKIPINQ